MTEKIKVYTNYNENNGTHYYRHFTIVDKLPNVGELIVDNGVDKEQVKSIREITPDYEQPNDKVWDYDYYEIETDKFSFDMYDGEDSYYYAVKKENIDE